MSDERLGWRNKLVISILFVVAEMIAESSDLKQKLNKLCTGIVYGDGK